MNIFYFIIINVLILSCTYLIGKYLSTSAAKAFALADFKIKQLEIEEAKRKERLKDEANLPDSPYTLTCSKSTQGEWGFKILKNGSPMEHNGQMKWFRYAIDAVHEINVYEKTEKVKLTTL